MRDGNEEIGRELKVSDLKPRTIVAIKPPNLNAYTTAWVREITPHNVVFYLGELGLNVVNFRQPDDTLTDDHWRPIHVYEYLGEP